MRFKTNKSKYFCYIGRFEGENFKLTDINEFEIVYKTEYGDGTEVINNRNYKLYVDTPYYKDVKLTLDLIRKEFNLDFLYNIHYEEGTEIFYDFTDNNFLTQYD